MPKSTISVVRNHSAGMDGRELNRKGNQKIMGDDKNAIIIFWATVTWV